MRSSKFLLGFTVACVVVAAPAVSASAEPSQGAAEFTDITFVDPLIMDVEVTYSCAEGAARGVAAVVEQTQPAPEDPREIVTSSLYSESITCDGTVQRTTLRLSGVGNGDHWVTPGTGRAQVTIYDDNGVMGTDSNYVSW